MTQYNISLISLIMSMETLPTISTPDEQYLKLKREFLEYKQVKEEEITSLQNKIKILQTLIITRTAASFSGSVEMAEQNLFIFDDDLY